MDPPRATGTSKATIVGVAAALALIPVGAAACGPDGSAGHPDEPTLPAVDFRPGLVLEISDEQVRATHGERADPRVRTDPPTVPSGSVIEVRNTASRAQRLRGSDVFDTGMMLPGERTTIVVTNPGAEPREIPIDEVITDTERGRLIVEASGPAS